MPVRPGDGKKWPKKKKKKKEKAESTLELELRLDIDVLKDLTVVCLFLMLAIGQEHVKNYTFLTFGQFNVSTKTNLKYHNCF